MKSNTLKILISISLLHLIFFNGLLYAQSGNFLIIDNFETGLGNWKMFDESKFYIVKNPLITDADNRSNNVLKFIRPFGSNDWSGVFLDKQKIPLGSKSGQYRYAHVKILKSQLSDAGIKVSDSSGRLPDCEILSINKPLLKNEWEDYVFDFGHLDGIYDELFIMPEKTYKINVYGDIVLYMDDIVFNNDPNPQISVSKCKIKEFKYSDVTESSVVLKWRAIPKAYYHIYCNNDIIRTCSENETIIDNLLPNTNYRFQVAARNGEQLSEISNSVVVKTLDVNQIETITNLNYDGLTTNSFSVFWDKSSSGDKYEIYLNGNPFCITEENKVSFSDLKPYTKYTVSVVRIWDNKKSVKKDISIVTHETDEQRSERTEWYRKARFGFFIHFGTYAQLGGYGPNYTKNPLKYEWQPCSKEEPWIGYGEWIMNNYDIPLDYYIKEAVDKFHPVNYDPEKWMDLAEDCGMKYVVLTAKHHEGIALFDSKVSEWNTVQRTMAKKDLIRPFVEAARMHNLKIGFYYSQNLDWINGGGGRRWDDAMDVRSFEEYVEDIGTKQVVELLSNYGKIDVLWWDMGMTEKYKYMAKKYFNAVSRCFPLQNGLILNGRLSDYYPEIPTELLGDFLTPEQSVPDVPVTGYENKKLWETCLTLNETWGYKQNDNLWKSEREIIYKLSEIVSKGGNLLLNVGPKPDGTFPEEAVTRLKKVGAWLKVNGEAIYGTEANLFKDGFKWGYSTTKKRDDGTNTLYFHIFDWPETRQLFIPVANKDVKAYFLSDKEKNNLDINFEKDGIIIFLPESPLDTICTVLALDIDGPVYQDLIITEQDDDKNLKLIPQNVMFNNNSKSICVEKNFEDRYNIGCWTDNSDYPQWFVKLNNPGLFKVQAEISSVSDGNILIGIDGKRTIPAKFENTNSYTRYEKQSWGEVSLDNTEQIFLIQIKASQDKWSPLNIRNIEFLYQGDGGLGTNKLLPVTIYMNSVTKEISLDFSMENNSPVLISIYSILGMPEYQRIFENCQIGSNHIDLPFNKEGIWILQFRTGHRCSTFKFVIK